MKLPKRSPSHQQEARSLKRFEALVPGELFIVREETGGDYGTDRILELLTDGAASNLRVHVQVKSIRKAKIRSDGTMTFPVPITTLNYLLRQENSLFTIYLENHDCFLWEWVKEIDRAFSLSDRASKHSKTFRFRKRLDPETFLEIYQTGLRFFPRMNSEVFDNRARLRRFAEKYPEMRPAIIEEPDRTVYQVVGADLGKLPPLAVIPAAASKKVVQEKWERCISTGEAIRFAPGEIEGIQHPLSGLTGIIPPPKKSQVLEVSGGGFPIAAQIDLLLLSCDGKDSVIKRLPVTLQCTAEGTKSATFQVRSVSDILQFVLVSDKTTDAVTISSLECKSSGKAVKDVVENLEFLNEMKKEATVAFDASMWGAKTFRLGRIHFALNDDLDTHLSFGRLLLKIGSYFGTEMRWPSEDASVYRNLIEGLKLAAEENRYPRKFASITTELPRATLTKILESRHLSEQASIRIVSHGDFAEDLFGNILNFGKAAITFENAVFEPDLEVLASRVEIDVTTRVKVKPSVGSRYVAEFERFPHLKCEGIRQEDLDKKSTGAKEALQTLSVDISLPRE